jgi:O-antigen/teichoic acid export membrane protein
VLQEVAQLSIVVLKGELRVGETAVLNVARQAIWVGGGALLIGYGLETEAIIYSLLVGLGIMLIWGWYKSSVTLERPTVSHARSLFDYGRYNVVSSIGGYFYSWMDVAIIGLFLTQAHVGAYEVAWRVTTVSILFSNAIAMTMFPQVSEWSADGAKERIESLIGVVMTPSLFFVIPAFFGTVVFSQEILQFVFGQEYTTATVVLIVLMGDKVFQAIQLVVGRSLQAINKPDLAAQATVVSVVSNGVLNVIFVLNFGILGAAVATVISSLLNDLLHLFYLRRHIHIRLPYREIIECIFAASVMTGVLLILESMHEVSDITGLIGYIFIGIISYGSSTLFLPNLRRRVFNISSQLLDME